MERASQCSAGIASHRYFRHFKFVDLYITSKISSVVFGFSQLYGTDQLAA